MVNVVSNVVAGRPATTGGILLAPTGTTAPTTASVALAAGFTAAGYIGDGGVTESINRSTSKIKAWGNDTVKVVQSDFSVEYKFTFLEALSPIALQAVYGSTYVTTTAKTSSTGTLQSIVVSGDVLPHQSFVFEIRDGLAKIRIYVPDGQITDVGDIKYVDSDVVSYDVTVEAYYNAAIAGQAKKFTDDGVWP